MAIIACLHAARSNIAVFEEALNALEFEDVELLHRVESQWLDQAVEASEVTPEIAEHVRQAIEELCQHADAVIVTCTTLGVVAWDARQFSKPVLRIDATLAKAASRYHGSVLVLCTAQSTLESTTHLFAAFVTGDRLAVELIPRAWAYFNDGDIEAYHREIAHYIQQRPECALGCIVLAQASMAGAEKYIHSTLAVLTGPQVVLQAAIEATW
ncbi:aspartate/glutamate racemase family protein [Erwinia sp. E_sp_B01_3]|uniref:aspartate/glutamate racemase family protein n=1 Tax=unclassified Erwinia TaxID=2622719 RepID=UPI0030D598B8